MAEYEKKVRKLLKDYGCFLVRHGKGDHDVWFSPISGREVILTLEIKSRHLANKIMKQAGIPYKFR